MGHVLVFNQRLSKVQHVVILKGISTLFMQLLDLIPTDNAVLLCTVVEFLGILILQNR